MKVLSPLVSSDFVAMMYTHSYSFQKFINFYPNIKKGVEDWVRSAILWYPTHCTLADLLFSLLYWVAGPDLGKKF